MTTLISREDLTAAAARIAPVAVRTPLLPFDSLSETLGVELLLKPEMLQRGGAFKFRGAYNFLAQLSPAERSRGVIAPSSGNHAQAVAQEIRQLRWALAQLITLADEMPKLTELGAR